MKIPIKVNHKGCTMTPTSPWPICLVYVKSNGVVVPDSAF